MIGRANPSRACGGAPRRTTFETGRHRIKEPMSTYNPTNEEMLADIAAAAKYVYDIDITSQKWKVDTVRIKSTGYWPYIRRGGIIDVQFNSAYYAIDSPEKWREVIGGMLRGNGIPLVMPAGTAVVCSSSNFNDYNFPREIIRGNRKIIVYRLADIDAMRTIRGLRTKVFAMNMPPALAAIAEPFRAEWEAAQAVLDRPAPVTLEKLFELKKAPVGWYSTACLRYITASANYAADRAAAEHARVDIGDRLVAAADAQKWYVGGELTSAADIPI